MIDFQVCDQANVNFPIKIVGLNVFALYDTHTNMDFVPYACYTKLKTPPLIKTISAMSVHSATGHEFCAVGLKCYGVTIGKSQFRHTFIVCKRL